MCEGVQNLFKVQSNSALEAGSVHSCPLPPDSVMLPLLKNKKAIIHLDEPPALKCFSRLRLMELASVSPLRATMEQMVNTCMQRTAFTEERRNQGNPL